MQERIDVAQRCSLLCFPLYAAWVLRFLINCNIWGMYACLPGQRFGHHDAQQERALVKVWRWWWL